MKTLFLIFHGRFPDEKAASVFTAKGCEAFAGRNIKVKLLVPRRLGRIKEDIFEFYNIKNNFDVIYLPTIDFFKIPISKSIAFRVSFFVFSISCLFYLLFNANKEDIIYSNESLTLFFTSLLFKNTLYEIHDFPEKNLKFYNILLKGMRWLLITNRWKSEKIQKDFNIPKEKIIYEPNATNLKDFQKISKKEAREKLNLGGDKFLVVYGGHLHKWKGVDTLAMASKHISKDILIIFAGGAERDVEDFRKKYSGYENMRIVGFLKREEMSLWQKIADVLVLPNTAKEDISKYYTSPMKLFDYMATGNPIIASDIPSITEILNNQNSILIKPDNPKELAEKIKWAFNNQSELEKLSSQAFKDVQNHSWESRAERILEFINK